MLRRSRMDEEERVGVSVIIGKGSNLALHPGTDVLGEHLRCQTRGAQDPVVGNCITTCGGLQQHRAAAPFQIVDPGGNDAQLVPTQVEFVQLQQPGHTVGQRIEAIVA